MKKKGDQWATQHCEKGAKMNSTALPHRQE